KTKQKPAKTHEASEILEKSLRSFVRFRISDRFFACAEAVTSVKSFSAPFAQELNTALRGPHEHVMEAARRRQNRRTRCDRSTRGAAELAEDHRLRRPARSRDVRRHLLGAAAHRIPSHRDPVLLGSRHPALPAAHGQPTAELP